MEVEPAKYFVRVIQREKRACRGCEQATVKTAPVADRIVEKGLGQLDALPHALRVAADAPVGPAGHAHLLQHGRGGGSCRSP